MKNSIHDKGRNNPAFVMNVLVITNRQLTLHHRMFQSGISL